MDMISIHKMETNQIVCNAKSLHFPQQHIVLNSDTNWRQISFRPSWYLNISLWFCLFFVSICFQNESNTLMPFYILPNQSSLSYYFISTYSLMLLFMIGFLVGIKLLFLCNFQDAHTLYQNILCAYDIIVVIRVLQKIIFR